jgi:hypothetical protein
VAHADYSNRSFVHFRLSLFPADPGLGLLVHDIEQISHRQIHVHQMQTPILQHLAISDQVSRMSSLRVQFSATAAQRRRIRARGALFRIRDFAESRVRRRRRAGAKRRICNFASRLRCRTAQRLVLECAAHIFSFRDSEGRSGQDRRKHPRLNRLSVDFLANQFRENE